MNKYADADRPACKYCGGTAHRVPTEGAPYWRCDKHDRLQDSEVIV